MSTVPEQLKRSVNRVRQSFAAHYDECPHSAMLGEKHDAFGHQLNRGTLLHDFACSVVTRCVASGERSYPPERGRELMVELIARSGLAVNAKEHDTLMLLAWTFCTSHEFEVDDVEDLEAEYSVEIEGVLLTGRPDFIARRGVVLTIRDYKTAWGMDPESELIGTFQGRFYAVLGFTAFPEIERVQLLWEYVRWGDRGVREIWIERRDLPRHEQYLRSLIRRILKSRETDEWPAIPDPSWCSRCPAPMECPLLTSEKRLLAPRDDDEAQTFAKQAIVMEAALKLRKKQLRAWVSEHGPVELDEGDFVLELGKDQQRIDENARTLMEQQGIDWRRFAQTVKGSTTFRYRKREAGS